jgi:two-component system, chemotaxis family, chemotaxis protein CheY
MNRSVLFENSADGGEAVSKSGTRRFTQIVRKIMAKTILIVDDSTSLRLVVGISLRAAGYELIEGEDGIDALQKMDGRKIHLIISDLNMPNMDGIGFVKAVKTLPSYKFTPIIMLTTESAENKKREGQEAGVRAWVVKPFRPQVILHAVQKLILP